MGMYLRRISRKNKNGSTTAYLQLAHNEWDPVSRCAKAKVIHSFGREDQVDVDALKRLAESISRMLPASDALEIQSSLSDGREGVELLGCKAYGGAWMLDGLWRVLGIPDIFKDVFGARSQLLERLVFAMVANRALNPSSKLAMEDWVAYDAEIAGLEEVQSHQLYRAMDDLLEAKDSIECQVYNSVADLMSLEVDLLYFDTTSSYFEVDPCDSEDEFRKLGYSKDSRADLLQVVIGLAVTKEGIPIRSWVWKQSRSAASGGCSKAELLDAMSRAGLEQGTGGLWHQRTGNTADMSVVKEVKQDLIGWKLGRVIQVMDRGFVSEDNLKELQKAGGHYILGEKLRSGKPETDAALGRAGRYQQVKENLLVKEITVGDGERRKRYVLCYNPSEAQKQKATRDQAIKDLEAELKTLCQQPDEAHTKAMCRLRTHGMYGKYIKQNKNGTLRIDRAAVKAEEKYDGKYLLRTSDDTLTSEDVALGYKQLTDVEDAFRTLKTHLELRPMYHRLEDRIRAHILLCWLALLLVRIIENKTGERWAGIRREMQRIFIGDFKAKDGRFKQVSKLNNKQREWLNRLGLKAPPTLVDIRIKGENA